MSLAIVYYSDAYNSGEMAKGQESNSELELYIKCEAMRKRPHQEVVILSRVLADDCNQGTRLT